MPGFVTISGIRYLLDKPVVFLDVKDYPALEPSLLVEPITTVEL